MFVLGIDPGLTRCGFGLVCRSSTQSNFEVVTAGVLETSRDDAVEFRLSTLQSDLEELIQETEPDVLVVERIFSQANVKSVVSVAQASGLVLALAARRGIPVVHYSPNEVKLSVAGSGAAGKKDVQAMVARLCSLREVPSPPDVADAIALAICYLSSLPLNKALEAARS